MACSSHRSELGDLLASCISEPFMVVGETERHIPVLWPLLMVHCMSGKALVRMVVSLALFSAAFC
jgi:hypothetical protein